MNVVLDTNVLVSAFKTPLGVCDQIVEEAIHGGLRLCYDERILAEYKEVLFRPYLGFEPFYARIVLVRLIERAVLVFPTATKMPLPDETDRAFLEVALTEQVDCLVTGNLKHYPVEQRQGALVLAPAEFLELYRKSWGRGKA